MSLHVFCPLGDIFVGTFRAFHERGLYCQVADIEPEARAEGEWITCLKRHGFAASQACTSQVVIKY